MKRKILSACFFLALCVSFVPVGRAQFTMGWVGSTTWIGVQGGASFFGETFDSLPDNASNTLATGLIGGITGEHWFTNNLAVGVGILFDQKGVQEQYSSSAINRQVPPGGDTIYSGNDNFSMNYLEVPILLKYALGTGFIRPYLSVGPSIGFLLSASETTTQSSQPSQSIQPVSNLKSYLAPMDISLYGGLGAMDEIDHGPILFFEAGYAAGLTNIFKTTPPRVATTGTPFPQPIDPSTAKSGDIRVTIGAMWEM